MNKLVRFHKGSALPTCKLVCNNIRLTLKHASLYMCNIWAFESWINMFGMK